MTYDPNWKGEQLKDHYSEFVEWLKGQGFSYVSQGSFRQVFQREDKVIKVPLYSDGLVDNMVEARAYKKYHNGPTSEGLYLAPCRLLRNGCLMMVYVKRFGIFSRPEWADRIDGSQVGTYLGRVVAYDYALELPERFEWEREWNKRSRFFNSSEWEEVCGSEQVLAHLRRMRQEELVA